ncbi:hypothetical protein ACFL7M_10215 [Thermodesulfobacteriota bacterium]
MNTNSPNNQFEVLSPWADVDPIPLKGISPRVSDLAGKKIGLFCNSKRVAVLALKAVESKLKERFPTCETSWYGPTTINASQIESEFKKKFEEWIDGIDVAVTSFGD